jgi:putative membrane protein
MTNHTTLTTLLFGALISMPVVMTAQIGSPQGPGSMPQQNRPSPNITDPNQTGEPNAITQSRVDDKTFVKDAAEGGLTEIQLGKLAQEKASSDAVKQFGQRMVDDHTKANEQLKRIAAEANITVPDSIDSKRQARIDKLSALIGTQFDQAFIKDQLKDHEEDVRKFQAEAENGSNAQIKSFASSTLPTLKEHLNMAKDLKKSKGSSMTSSTASSNGNSSR